MNRTFHIPQSKKSPYAEQLTSSSMSMVYIQNARFEAILAYLLSLGAELKHFETQTYSIAISPKLGHMALTYKRKTVYANWWRAEGTLLHLEQQWYPNEHCRKLMK